jgi:hypothetical protein
MKSRKEVSEAKRKVLDTYPTAKLVSYNHGSLGGRYGVIVPLTTNKLAMWLESTSDSSATRDKAWIDAHKFILREFLRMLHY